MVYLEQDPRFFNRLIEVSNNVGLNPEDLLVVMALESGINPSVHNNNYGGLVQMSNDTLNGLGYSGNVKDFSNEPAFKQLDYIEKHILRLANLIGGKFNSATQYYIGNLLPVGLKLKGVKDQDPNTIIVAQNPTQPHLPNVSIANEKIYYNSNKGLDLDKDGAITYKDIDNFLNKKRNEIHYKNAISQLPKQKENNTSSDYLLNQLDSFLKSVASDNKSINVNNFSILVIGEDLSTSIEFARVLAIGLREELNAKTTTHMQDNKIEVSCTINGSKEMAKKLIQAFTDNLSNCFFDKTKEIGGLKVVAKIVNHKKSNYDFIDYRTASLYYRKFLSKFIGK